MALEIQETQKDKAASARFQRPEWLKAKIPSGKKYVRIDGIMRSY
jgi:lipoate synthase